MAHRCKEAAARDQAVKEVDRGGQENGNRHFGLPLLHSRIRANQDVAGVAPNPSNTFCGVLACCTLQHPRITEGASIVVEDLEQRLQDLTQECEPDRAC